jgi:hypothetical protein
MVVGFMESCQQNAQNPIFPPLQKEDMQHLDDELREMGSDNTATLDAVVR